MTPLRVCIDARLRSSRWGGVEQVVIGIAAGLSGLDRENEDYRFLTLPGHDQWIRPYLQARSELLHSRRGGPGRLARALTQALAGRVPFPNLRHKAPPSDGTVEAVRADVVHFTLQKAFLTDVPSVYHPHDLQHLHLPEFFTRRQIEWREAIYRTHCARASTVVAMTSWGRQDLIDRYGLPEEKVFVVPWASVLGEYPTPSSSQLNDLRRRWSLPERFVLYPAQTHPHKNHAGLLEALALLRDRDGIVVPLVCPGGHTSHFKTIKDHIRRLGMEDTTWFPGFLSPVELRGLYELAEALVFPSKFEGWGLPVCEAFSAGLPVACSGATSLRDLVGDAGLIFDPDQTDDIAHSVMRLWTDETLRGSLTRKGLKRGSQFSWERTARLFRAHYRRIGQRPLADEDRMLLASDPLA